MWPLVSQFELALVFSLLQNGLALSEINVSAGGARNSSSSTSSRPTSSSRSLSSENSFVWSTTTAMTQASMSFTPHEIVTSRTGNRTFENNKGFTRPYWMYGDDEPLSCYPDYLYESPPKWWGNQTIGDNKCYTIKSDGCKDWTYKDCWLHAQREVELIYFPTTTRGQHNITTFEPSTLYDPHFDHTFTSPSVYVLFHSLNAYKGCSGHPIKNLGPTLKHAFTSFNLSDISTLAPLEKGVTKTVMTPRQLTLDDLQSGCTMSYDRSSAFSNNAPRVGDHGYRCFPRLAFLKQISHFAEPWWKGCEINLYHSGMVDPPYALRPGTFPVSPSPLPGGINDTPDPPPVTVADPVSAPTQPPAAPVPSPSNQPGPTAASMPATSNNSPPANNNPSLDNSPPNSKPSLNNLPSSDDSPSSNNSPSPNNNPSSNDNQPFNNNPLPNNNPTPNNSPSSLNNPSSNHNPSANTSPEQNNPSPNAALFGQAQAKPPSAVSVAIIGTEVISALPPSSASGSNPAIPAAVILPGSSTLQAGSHFILPVGDGSRKSVVVSVNPVGNVLLSTVGAGSANTIAVNQAGAGLAVVSTIGATSANTIALHGAAPRPITAISIGNGAVMVYRGQTLTQGGAIATISAGNEVVSYGPSGVVVQYPGGKESTIPVVVGTAATSSGSSGDNGYVAGLINSIMGGSPSPTVLGGAPAGKPTVASWSGSASGAGGNSSYVPYTGGSSRNKVGKLLHEVSVVLVLLAVL